MGREQGCFFPTPSVMNSGVAAFEVEVEVV